VAKKQKDEYEEFGWYYCADTEGEKPKKGCGRKAQTQGKCCDRPMKFFDNFLFYFDNPTRFQRFKDRFVPTWCRATRRFWFKNCCDKFRRGMIAHEEKTGPVLAENITFTNNKGRERHVTVYSRLPLTPHVIRKWLVEFDFGK